MDRRVAKSRSAIKKALCDLVNKKGFANVTATEVAQLAGINRSTFYLHYQSLDAVLYDIEDDLVKKVIEMASAPVIRFEEYIYNLASGIVPLAVPIRVVLASSYAHFQRKLETVLIPLIGSSPYTSAGGAGPEEEKLIITFLLDGSIGTVAAFFRSNLEPTEEDVRRLVRDFIAFFNSRLDRIG